MEVYSCLFLRSYIEYLKVSEHVEMALLDSYLIKNGGASFLL